jgi:hypothetical protein
LHEEFELLILLSHTVLLLVEQYDSINYFGLLCWQLQQVMGRLATAQSELQDERQMNHALQQNQSAWQAKFQALEKQFNEHKTAKDKVAVMFLLAYMSLCF